MKRSRGLTLIELVTALAIVSILLPVLGYVFYQVLVIPPDQTAKMTLNDEISRLASMLYRDGYMAENFTQGTFPVYGYFNWTDYTTGNNHYVTYYYNSSCVGGETEECDHIVREEVVATPTPEGTPLPTPTPTPTSEPTPTPTSLPTPTPTTVPDTYTYCDNWGVDKWAWSRTWSYGEFYTCGRPLSLSDFFNLGISGSCVGELDSPYPLVTANESIYNSICSIDANCWLQTDYNPSYAPGGNTELFTFKVYQDRSSVTNVSVTFVGRGTDASTDTIYYLRVYLWDYIGNQWIRYVNVNGVAGCNVIHTYTFSNTSYPQYYIQSGSGNVTILATAHFQPVYPSQGVYTDYIELQIH